MILGEVTEQRERNEVQHDGGDDFVRSELRFEYARDAAPDRPGDNRGDAAQRHQNNRGQMSDRRNKSVSRIRCAELKTDPGSRKRCHVKLSFSANIQETTAKSYGHRETREDQRRRI